MNESAEREDEDEWAAARKRGEAITVEPPAPRDAPQENARRRAAQLGLEEAPHVWHTARQPVLDAGAALGSVYAAAYFTGALPGSSPPDKPASCTPTTTTYASEQFVLNVYNASSGQGKAKETARALKANHFNVGVISNDPYKMKLTSVGQIRFGPKGEQNAKQYVQKLVPDAQLMAG